MYPSRNFFKPLMMLFLVNCIFLWAQENPVHSTVDFRIEAGRSGRQAIQNSMTSLSDYCTCEDVDASYNPVNIKDTFYSNDTYVCSWVKFVDEPAEFSVKWEFYKPNGTKYSEKTLSFTGPPAPPWSEARGAYKVGISGNSAANYEGTWTIKIYKDGEQIITDNFELLIYCEPPVAAFSATPRSGCAPLSVTFTDLSTQSGNSCTIIDWQWDFGDGGTHSSQHPNHSYTNPGTYTVILQVTNNKDGTDTEVKEAYITVEDCRPGYINGLKFLDEDQDGVRDGSEPGIQNWKIMLNTGANTYTEADGSYSFEVDPGTYSVSEENKTGYTQTYPLLAWNNLVVAAGQTIENVNFGNYAEPGGVSGIKFNDKDKDGKLDNDEEGIEGWTIHLSNGLTCQTESNGAYHFQVPEGEYVVSEELPDDWVQSYPPAGTWNVSISPGLWIEGRNFGNYLKEGIILGEKFRDDNYNGIKDNNETGLEGWKIYLEGADESIDSTLTDKDGKFSFTADPESYFVYEENRNNWVQTCPPFNIIDPNQTYLIELSPGEIIEGVDFGNWPEYGMIMGKKFEDRNRNGELDDNEPGLPGWIIQLDNGQRDTTDNQGNYSIEVRPGPYIVTEIVIDNWIQSYPPEQWNITVAPGQVYEAVNFGNYPEDATIMGEKFRDENFDGIKDSNEVGLEGWKIYLEGNVKDSTLTDRDGKYSFTTYPNFYFVYEENRNNWEQTCPDPNILIGQTYALELSPGEVVEEVDFGNWPEYGIIMGKKFEDRNKNGEMDDNESGLPGWTIQLDNGPTAVTDSLGNYSIEVRPGTYIVTEILIDNWVQSYPLEQWNITVGPGQIYEGVNFGNYPEDGIVFGKKFLDQNKNSKYDTGEPGLEGWTIKFNEYETLTDSEGNYQISLRPGHYSVQEDLKIYWTMTYPQFREWWHVDSFPIYDYELDVGAGQLIEGIDFGNFPDDGTITGMKFHDENKNGVKDSNETGLEGWIIKLDDTDSTVTDANGFYSLKAQAGTHHVTEVDKEHWIQSYPLEEWNIEIDPGEIREGIDFGNYPEDAQIRGKKFLDRNKNGKFDEDEPGLQGWVIKIDIDDSTFTDENGNYSFTVIPGIYLVEEVLKDDWGQSCPVEPWIIILSPGEIQDSVFFGNYPKKGSISGKKFLDLNKNGEYDNVEPGLQGWVIKLNNGDSTVTNENGSYFFELSPGEYVVTEKMKSGWIQSYPVEGSHTVTVNSGVFVEGKNFGNYPKDGGITGQKFQDNNGNGKWDSGEPALPGWTIQLSTGATAVTDAHGSYFFPVSAGTYTVSEVLQPGWTQSFPSAPGTHVVSVNPGNVAEGRDFGNIPPGGMIGGWKFFDGNENGQYDEGEFRLNGFVIELYDPDRNLVATDTTGVKTTGAIEISDVMNIQGIFKFYGLLPGIYFVKEQIPEGWPQTVPENNEYEVELGLEESVDGLIFGNISFQLDWGDLPDTAHNSQPHPPGFPWQWYPTLKPKGAGHAAFGAYLGMERDVENDGQPTDFADGDDKTDKKDEDGVQYLSWVPSVSGEVQVTVGGNPADFPVWLSAWIDFDDDGYLEFPMVLPLIIIPDEFILLDKIPKAGTYRYMFPIPADNYGPGYARFRLCSNFWSALFPFGIALDGEVEDYVGIGFDFGDANNDIDPDNNIYPYGYPVKLVDDGARHLPTPLIKLGPALTDADRDGQPGRHATGDDYDNRDDEDGIQWESGYSVAFDGLDPLLESKDITVIGFTRGTDVSFKPLASRTGYLYAWIDYNRDGDWDDTGENIFNNEWILPGPDYTLLTFKVPNEISLGLTYLRFRFVTDHNANVKITGVERDGEVEDYLVILLPEIDYADSPPPYPTLVTEYGPKHYLSYYYLGELIDSEPDGIHEYQALGDDNSYLDDEDGIRFMNSFSAGKELKFTVYSNVPAGGSGFLNTWLDIDQDGAWDTNTERMISDKELFGGLDTLSFFVPDNSVAGYTFMRFRFSSQKGLDPYDSTPFNSTFLCDGEVEDYRVSVDTTSSAIEEYENIIPDKFRLYQNHPNPFNNSTVITFDIAQRTPVILEIYNMLGQLVARAVDDVMDPGQYQIHVEMNENPAGLYFYSIKMGDYSSTKKMLYLK
ncbi:MAG: PKD domain-containing protein [Candidatus Marinimicrobia bacterium]|nr:PKD domain-containing protein [Candidatus Neomarinimicrobiota bacterium]